MVTPQGFNALLKIVEEPPEHVKFVFATTEPDKVIGTIRSRTHHYPFRLVPPGQLTDYMARLCEQEGVTVAPGVLSFVTRAGGGSVRDSLSVLDQLIAGSGDEGLTYESAASLLGFTDGELLDATVDAFAAGDAAGVFHQVDRVIETGLDPRRFVEDLLERLRDLIVVAAVPDGASSVLRGHPEDQIERMRQQAAAFGPGTLSRAADIVNAGLTEMTGATAPRLQLELICARVLLPGASGESGYAARLDRIERRLDVGGVPTAARPAVPGTAARQAPPETRTANHQGQESRAGAEAVAAPVGTAPTAAAPSREQEPVDPRTARAASTGRGEESDAQPQAPAPSRPAAPGAASPRPDLEPASAPEPAPPAASSSTPSSVPTSVPAPVPAAAPAAGGIDTAAIRRAWPDVLGWLSRNKRVTWTLVSDHAQVLSYDGRRLELGIAPTTLLMRFRQGPHTELIRQALIDVLGVDARVEGVPAPEGAVDAGSGLPGSGVPGSGLPGGGIAGGGGAAHPTAGPSGPGPDSATAAPQASAAGTPPQDPAAWHVPESSEGWATAPSAPGTAPSWQDSASQRAAPEFSHAGAPAPVSHLKRAMAAVEAEGPAATERTRVADDSAASDDDEDIEGLGEVGRPVIERILGGRVIEEG
jgi:DNA polymerase-3 subunit gamma/tau